MANLGTSAMRARRMAFTWEGSVSLIKIRISLPCGQPSTISVFIDFTFVVQAQRPRRPPFFLVPSWAMGVTSSIRVMVIPARVRARMAA